MIKPDIENAALKAIETLIKYHVSYAPVSPLPILKSMQGVAVVSYAEMAETIGMERSSVLKNVSPESRDAGTPIPSTVPLPANWATSSLGTTAPFRSPSGARKR